MPSSQPPANLPVHVPNPTPPALNTPIPLPRNRIVRRLPQVSQGHAARRMVGLLEDVNRLNDDEAWMKLLNFPSCYLCVPVRGGKRGKLARLLNDQLALDKDDPLPSPATSSMKKSQAHPIASLAARVSAKLEEGDFRGAIRLASTEDTIAEENDATVAARRLKHPAAHPHSSLKMQALPGSADTLAVTKDAVTCTIHSFPKGSSGG